MSLTALPASIRIATAKSAVSQRALHTTSSARASVLFALGALSNSRETAHFNRISGLPRYEHSPPLKIIKTSEVDAHPLPTPTRPILSSSVWSAAKSTSALQIWDDKALKIGQVFLSDQARQSQRMRHAMARAQRRQAKSDALLKRERSLWQLERMRLERDIRSAVLWILGAIGTATALAAWRFWPETSARSSSGDMGRKMAARAASAMPLPAAVGADPVTFASTTPLPAIVPSASSIVTAASPPTTQTSALQAKPEASAPNWLKGLFWKQPSS